MFLATASRTLLSIFGLVLHNSVATGFNVDLFKPIIISDPSVRQHRSSYFGYSVALYNYSADESGTKWVLVGAPRGNRQSIELYPQPIGENNVTEPGVLYKCSLWSGRDNCTEVILDTSGNTHYYPPNADTSEVTNKQRLNHGWVGVSMDVQPTQYGRMAICGHLWSQEGRKLKLVYANGVCYWTHGYQVANGSQVIQKHVPLFNLPDQTVTDIDTKHLFGMGQLGIASHLPKNGKELLMGAPGVNVGRGIAVRFRDEQKKSSSGQPETQGPSDEGLFSIVDAQKRKLRGVGEDSYWGYAVASGIFKPDGVTWYVAGAPRAGSNLTGEVHLFEYTNDTRPRSGKEKTIINVRQAFSGKQLGEFYGASVAALDIDGDGLDDLAIGAPLFTPSASPLGGRLIPEQGRVAVFLNSRRRGGFEPKKPGQELFGSKSHMARFGQTLSAIGDINRDGFEDLAVGAPYEDNGAGAVYVYLGSDNNGFRPEPQVIKASSFNRPTLRGFGISVSRGVDMDNNGYPDIVVGSYESGHAVILRSRPVAYLNVSLVTSPRQLAVHNLTAAPKVLVEVSVEYASIGGPGRLDVEVTLTADARRRPPRGKFLIPEGAEGYSTPKDKGHMVVITIPATKGGLQSRSLDLEISSGDFTKSLVIQADIRLPDPETRGVQDDLNCENDNNLKPTFLGPAPVAGSGKLKDFCKTYPILDPLSSTRAEFTTSFVNGCGGDDECTSNLAIYASWLNETSGTLVIGTKKSGTVLVHVTNNEEPAFDTVVNVGLSERLSLARPPPTCSLDLSPSVPASDYGRRWLCGIGTVTKENPMDPLEFQIEFGQLTALMTELEVKFAVKSSSLEKYDNDNFDQAHLRLEAEADITIMGRSFAEKNLYTKNHDRPEEKRKSPNVVRFEHHYQISKFGATPIDEVNVTFLFPVAFASSISAKPDKNSEATSYQLGGHASTTAAETFLNVSEKAGSNVRRCTFVGTAELLKGFRDPRAAGMMIPAAEIAGNPVRIAWQVAGNEADTIGDRRDGREPSANLRVLRSTGEHDGSEKRQTDSQAISATPTTRDESKATTLLDCFSGQFLCQEVRCVVGPFPLSGSTEFLEFQVAVDMNLIEPKLEAKKSRLQLVTDSKVTFPEEIWKPHGKHLSAINHRNDSAVVFTYLEPAHPPKETPLWWYIAAIVGGLTILALLALGLVKAGFFQRSKLEEIENIREQEKALLRGPRSAPDGQEFDNDDDAQAAEPEEICDG